MPRKLLNNMETLLSRVLAVHQVPTVNTNHPTQLLPFNPDDPDADIDGCKETASESALRLWNLIERIQDTPSSSRSSENTNSVTCKRVDKKGMWLLTVPKRKTEARLLSRRFITASTAPLGVLWKHNPVSLFLFYLIVDRLVHF